MNLSTIKNRTILQGDVLEKLLEIPEESIDCVITSPPYWGLRDYGIVGQWGLEPQYGTYLIKMMAMMTCLWKILKKTGTCWINLGDCYGSHRSNEESIQIGFDKQERDPIKGYEKSRMGIPERFYVMCIDDGWIARNHIPWIKENSMPSSVKDRFTNKWESIFFFVKQQKYYFNLDAVRVKPKGETKPFNVRVRDAKKGLGQLKLGDNPKAWKMSDEEDKNYNKKGERKQDNVLGKDGKPKANYKGFNERWKQQKVNCPVCGKWHSVNAGKGEGYVKQGLMSDRVSSFCDPKGKNPGDVFFINPRPFPEAHFATFPINLPLKILKCACPKDGIVLDPFFGAGTVGMAAEQLGLNWIGIELKQEYIDITRKRLKPYQNERLN